MHSHGKSSNGILQDSLVVGEGQLTKNLVSIPKLDLMGYTITFRGGKGVVTGGLGNIITSAPLSSKGLYEFDIRQMYGNSATTPSALLGSVSLPDSDPWTWHLRLGHRNLTDIRRAIRLNLLVGIPFEMLTNKNKVRAICDACARSKSTKYTGRTLVHQDVVK